MQRILIITFLMLASVWFLGSLKLPTTENPTKTETLQKIATTSPPSTIEVTSTPTTTTTTVKTATTTKLINKATKPETKAKPVTIPADKINVSVSSPEPAPNFELINTYTRLATVNILCTTKGGELLPISGTGVVVKPDGLILTNAHVAEYLLLRDFRQKDFVECVIRTDSPAYPRYNVEIVYISPTWVSDNKAILKESDPKGTGENDFAFLRITSAIDGSNLPETFPYIQMNLREIINKNEPVLLVSYPAGFLGGLSVLQNLNITSAITTIQEIFTFKENTIDILAVPGTIVSQKGSSGGAVVDRNTTLIGLITTSSGGNTTNSRALNAITIAYINRSMQNEIGIGLSEFIYKDMADFAKIFQKVNVPGLTKLIIDELNKNQ